MSRPKETKKYPAVYLDYADVLNSTPEKQILVEFDTVKEAKSFRLDFYAFKSAALNEGLDGLFPEIAAFTVELRGSTAVVRHKDYTEQAQKMKAALKRLG